MNKNRIILFFIFLAIFTIIFQLGSMSTVSQAGIIVHLVEPGYRINDRILRPARVGVSKSEK